MAKPKATPMYLEYAQMYLDTRKNDYPKQDFCQLYMKKKPGVNYSTAEVKWKILNAAYEVFLGECYE